MQAPFAILLAGGVGTRLAPLSTPERPKQVLPLMPDGRTPLAAALSRVMPLVGPDRVLVVTGAPMASAVRDALPELREDAFLVEPEGRNTLPALCWATAEVARRGGDGVLSLHADHWVGDEAAFRETMRRAITASAHGLTLVGLTPEFPSTELGWMVTDPMQSGGCGRVRRFVEKPPAEVARALMDAGGVWNMGTFVWRTDSFDQALRCNVPMHTGFEALRRGAEPAAVWRSLPKVSVDHGLLEHTTTLMAVEGRFGWSDLGTWERVYALHGEVLCPPLQELCDRTPGVPSRNTSLAANAESIPIRNT